VDNFSKYKIHQLGEFYICNQGISFNININKYVLFVLYAIFILLLIYETFREFNKNKIKSFIIALILIGALSNIFDRILYSCIIDFIPFPFFNKLYFNISDVYISTGIITLIVFFKKDVHKL
jgi:signal peptidase II